MLCINLDLIFAIFNQFNLLTIKFIKISKKYRLLACFKLVVCICSLLYSFSIPTIATQQISIQYFLFTSWLVPQQNPLKDTQSEQESSQEAAATDFSKNLKQLIETAEKGNAKAQYELCMKHYQEKDVSQNYQEAFKWFWQAEAEGHLEAQKYLDELTNLI